MTTSPFGGGPSMLLGLISALLINLIGIPTSSKFSKSETKTKARSLHTSPLLWPPDQEQLPGFVGQNHQRAAEMLSCGLIPRESGPTIDPKGLWSCLGGRLRMMFIFPF